MNDVAKFYLRSFFDKDVDGYTITGDYDNQANATDRNRLTYAETSGQGTDGDSTDYIVDLSFDRTIDAVVLKSNLKTFTIYIWDENETGTGGAGYVELTSYAANTSEFLLIDVGTEVTSKIKITATHTITANQEKRINQFEATQKITEMRVEELGIEKRHETFDDNNIYGGSVKVTKYPNHGKVDIDLSWNNLTDTSYTAYAAIKAQSILDSFNIYIYYSDSYALLGEAAYYLVNDLDDFKSDPAGEALSTMGIKGSMELAEC